MGDLFLSKNDDRILESLNSKVFSTIWPRVNDTKSFAAFFIFHTLMLKLLKRAKLFFKLFGKCILIKEYLCLAALIRLIVDPSSTIS